MIYQTIFKSQINIDLGVFFILYTIIVGPIVEELFYREIIYNKLKKIFSIKLSIGITAALYAFSHIRSFTFSMNIIYLMFLGIFLTYLCEKTKKILAPICLHIMYNAFNTLIACLKQDFAILLYLIMFISALIIITIDVIKYVKARKSFNLVQSASLSESEK